MGTITSRAITIPGSGMAGLLRPAMVQDRRATGRQPLDWPTMKIVDLKTFVVAMPGHNVVLVKVETDEGLYGIGEASLAGRDRGVVGLLEHFRELLIGRDPSRIEDIWQN